MSNRPSPSLAASLATGLSALALSLPAAFVAGGALAQGRDPTSLGDLQIPVSRVPMWYDLDYLPLDTSGWTVVNVPCGSAASVQSALNAAGANTVVQLAPSCVYDFAGGSLSLDNSRVVLRGTGRDSTILEFSNNDGGGIMMGVFGWPPNQVFGDSRPWTAGYTLGTDLLTLAHTSGLQPGAWVRVRANSEPDWHPNARNGYSAKLACVGTAGTGEKSCTGLSANQVKLDRPLNSEFTQGGQQLDRVTGPFVEFAGMESLGIRHRTPSRIESYRPRLSIQDCHECWVVDAKFGDAGNMHIAIQDSARVAMRGNDFGSNQCTSDGATCLWNKGAVYYNEHAYDTVFENNSIKDSPSGPVLQNGGGNVVAFNFMTSGSSVQCERHVFLHGQGVLSSLVEGNDVDCMIEWDSYRDGQGYYNTMYRNRLRGSNQPTSPSYPGYYRGRLGCEAQGSFIHRYITVIGNHVNELQGSPFPTGVGIDLSTDSTHQHYRTWVSYNVARANIVFDPNAVETTQHQNHVRTSPPSGWSGVDFPPSLYRDVQRDGPPDWWCEESGPFPNIGAPSDTVGQYSRLPAEIRRDGGTCTLAGNPGSALPPPVILTD